jgi:hypothetical protein
MEFVEKSKKDIDVVIQTFLTESQVEIMKSKLKENGDLQLELYAIISLSTMARVNAISNITWKQICFESRTISDVLEKEGKKIDDNDLARIYNYISSLERSEQKLIKVREYINVLIKAIIEKGYDMKDMKDIKDTVGLKFLQDFAEKERKLINNIDQKSANLQQTISILITPSGTTIS